MSHSSRSNATFLFFYPKSHNECANHCLHMFSQYGYRHILLASAANQIKQPITSQLCRTLLFLPFTM